MLDPAASWPPNQSQLTVMWLGLHVFIPFASPMLSSSLYSLASTLSYSLPGIFRH